MQSGVDPNELNDSIRELVETLLIQIGVDGAVVDVIGKRKVVVILETPLFERQIDVLSEWFVVTLQNENRTLLEERKRTS